MNNTTKKILDDLKLSLSFVGENDDLDAVSWYMQEGVLISINNAKAIIKLIEESKIKVDIVDKILFRFDNTVCPSCGSDSWKFNAVQSETKFCKCGNEF